MYVSGGVSSYSGYQMRFSAAQKNTNQIESKTDQVDLQSNKLSQPQPKFGLAPASINYHGWKENKVQKHMKSFGETETAPYNAKFHAGRRQAFLDLLPPNSTVIIASNTYQQKNFDVDHDFRQDNNFFYLTGLNEPDSIAVLSNEEGKAQFTLILPPMTDDYALWQGKRPGIKGAIKKYKADEAFSNEDKFKVLKPIIQNSQHLMMVPAETNKKLNGVIRGYIAKNKTYQNKQVAKIENPIDKIYKLRVVKTPYEIALMQRAVDISIKGHLRAIKELKITPKLMKKNPHTLGKGLPEGTIQGVVEKEFRLYGGVSTAYPTIGTTGSNSCILHYGTNNEAAKPGNLAMIDAGTNYGYHTADISRTWPVGGKFTEPQKALYQIVLDAQKAGIKAAKPGVTLKEVDTVARKVVAEGLIRVGIIKNTTVDELWAKAKAEGKANPVRQYFPHRTSHTMGLDVHDAGLKDGKGTMERDYDDTPIEAGWVFSVEPGIYITEAVVEKEGLDPKWAGIGIRIEDDILATATGSKNLSKALPREIKDIEALMAGKSKLTRHIRDIKFY